MGKRIIVQARGHGSKTYRVRPKAYKFKVGYPSKEGIGEVKKIFHSSAHYAPLAKIKIGKEVFFNVAVNGLIEGQKITCGGTDISTGNILALKNIPPGTNICNIEITPMDGGKLVRSSGSCAKITKKRDQGVFILLPSKKEVILNERCRATIGVVAGGGRIEKPFVKAGTMFYKMKTRNKLWPRTSALKMNVIDHPFGSGRGKNIGKSKTPKRNAPPGRKVGQLRARKVGRGR